MRDQSLHGSGTRLVNTKDGVQHELERKARGSGEVKHSDEHNGSTIRICAVLIYGPSKNSV